jgi:hypothetical protein
MNPRIKAAVIGGVAAGLLSAITSVIPLVSCCCCLLALGGGVLTVFLYVKDTKLPVTPADGAKLAAIAGGIAAAIYFVINLVIGLIIGSAAMAAQMAQMERAGVSVPLSGIALQFVGALMGAVGVAVLTVLGGVLGAAIFGKGGAPGGAVPPPPPPPAGGYGGAGAPGAPGGGYGQPGGGGYGQPGGGGGGYGQPGGGGGYGQNP